jgi:hypothetical protein
MTAQELHAAWARPGSPVRRSARASGEVALIVSLLLSVAAVVLSVALYAGELGRRLDSGAEPETGPTAGESPLGLLPLLLPPSR